MSASSSEPGFSHGAAAALVNLYYLTPYSTSQGGVKEDVSRRGLDGGGGDLRHLMVIEFVPALLRGVLTVGSVMSTIQATVVILSTREKRIKQTVTLGETFS